MIDGLNLQGAMTGLHTVADAVETDAMGMEAALGGQILQVILLVQGAGEGIVHRDDQQAADDGHVQAEFPVVPGRNPLQCLRGIFEQIAEDCREVDRVNQGGGAEVDIDIEANGQCFKAAKPIVHDCIDQLVVADVLGIEQVFTGEETFHIRMDAGVVLLREQCMDMRGALFEFPADFLAMAGCYGHAGIVL